MSKSQYNFKSELFSSGDQKKIENYKMKINQVYQPLDDSEKMVTSLSETILQKKNLLLEAERELSPDSDDIFFSRTHSSDYIQATKNFIQQTKQQIAKLDAQLNEEKDKYQTALQTREQFLASSLKINTYPLSELWRLFIDGRHQTTNDPLIYDNPRDDMPGEPGYLRSMEKAYVLMNLSIQEPLSINWIMSIHDMAVSNVELFRLGDDSASKAAPGIRQNNSISYALSSYNSTPAGIKEIQEQFSDMAIIKDNIRYDARTDLKGEQTRLFITQKLQSFINDFNEEIKSENSEAKLRAIAKFIRKTDVLHPFEDGNIRTLMLVAYKLLNNNGFPQPIFENLNFADGYSVDEFAQILKTDIQKSVLLKIYKSSQ